MPNRTQVKLYDLRRRDHPSKRGDVFRSLQVIVCTVCGAKTNEVVIGGSPGCGVRTICPNAAECWHHELEDKLRLLAQPHPASYRQELDQEIAAHRAAHERDRKDDVVEDPDARITGWRCTNVRAYRERSRCPHDLHVPDFDIP